MFKCNYLDKLKDKNFQKLMISDQKHNIKERNKFSFKSIEERCTFP